MLQHDIERPFHVERVADGHFVLTGTMDVTRREEMRAGMAPISEAVPARPVVLDVGAVTFCDAAGLHELAALARRTGLDCAITLRHASPALRRLLERTGLDVVLAFDDTEVRD